MSSRLTPNTRSFSVASVKISCSTSMRPFWIGTSKPISQARQCHMPAPDSLSLTVACKLPSVVFLSHKHRHGLRVWVSSCCWQLPARPPTRMCLSAAAHTQAWTLWVSTPSSTMTFPPQQQTTSTALGARGVRGTAASP